MIFTELVLENFGPYYGKHVINLRPELGENSRPIILFGGMNGGGKTTLMDAIRLALYGQRAQCSTRSNLSYTEFLIQSVNSQALVDSLGAHSLGEVPSLGAHRKTRIELAFEHIVNEQWKDLRIVRTWSKNPKDGKDNLGILDGDWPDTALANIWDEYIENLLPLGISNLFLFDGEQVKELAEQDIPPTGVIDAIKSLLGLELAEKLAIDIDILVARKRKALANASQLANLEEIEAKLNDLNKQKEIAKQDLSSLQTKLESNYQKHQNAVSNFHLEGGKIAAEKSKLQGTRNYLANTLEKERQEMRELAAAILPLAMIDNLLKEAQIQAEKELKSTQAKLALSVLQERDKRLFDYLEKLSLHSAKIEEIKCFLYQENQALNNNVELADNPWLNMEAEGVQYLDNLVNNLISMQRQKVREYLNKLTYLQQEIDTTDRQLAIAAAPETYEKLDLAVKEAEKELFNDKAAYEEGKRKLEKIEREINLVKKDLEKYSEKFLEHQNNEHIIKSAAKVKKTLTLFREKLTLKKLNKLEAEVTECFRYLLHKSNLVHRVVIDTKNFSLSLFDANGQNLPKHRLSAGEKQLLAIAFLWSLARVSGRNLPVAIDTPLGRLDSSHRSNLVERYFPTASHQVILLSTDTEIGKNEVTKLRQLEAIANEYLLKYDPNQRQTKLESGYFW